MAYKKLPEGVLEFIRANAPGRGNAELAAMTNAAFGTSFTAVNIKGYKKYHRIRSDIKPKPPSLFTPEIQAFIFSNYEGVPYNEMAFLVNKRFGTSIPTDSFRWFYQNNNLRCGVRWTGKTLPVGTVSKREGRYQCIKMEDGSWRPYHHWLWEQAYGPIPPGRIVTFLDGNIQNTDISNLALVSRQEQMHLAIAGLRFDNPELTKTGILIAKVKIAANRQKKRGASDE